MKPVRYDDAADDEILEEVTRYELRRDGLGSEFLTAVRDAVQQIARNPAAWQESAPGRQVRRFVMSRFPFTIVYIEVAQEILILAIAPTSREPGYWRTRR